MDCKFSPYELDAEESGAQTSLFALGMSWHMTRSSAPAVFGRLTPVYR